MSQMLLPNCGSRVLSESEDAFLFDVGPTIVTDNYTEYMKLVRDVGLSDKVIDGPRWQWSKAE